jgi:hypothetical protein
MDVQELDLGVLIEILVLEAFPCYLLADSIQVRPAIEYS